MISRSARTGTGAPRRGLPTPAYTHHKIEEVATAMGRQEEMIMRSILCCGDETEERRFLDMKHDKEPFR